MRWIVADLHGARALVDALDLSRLERVYEQSVGTGAGALLAGEGYLLLDTLCGSGSRIRETTTRRRRS